jgi:hypothetical protein
MFYVSILSEKKSGPATGILLYMINGAQEVNNYFPEYHLTLSEDERKRILQRIESDALDLKNGVDSKDANLVRGQVATNINYMTKSGERWYNTIRL